MIHNHRGHLCTILSLHMHWPDWSQDYTVRTIMMLMSWWPERRPR